MKRPTSRTLLSVSLSEAQRALCLELLPRRCRALRKALEEGTDAVRLTPPRWAELFSHLNAAEGTVEDPRRIELLDATRCTMARDLVESGGALSPVLREPLACWDTPAPAIDEPVVLQFRVPTSPAPELRKSKSRAANRIVRMGHQPTADSVLQFRIELLGSEPLIWRQIQMPDATLYELHRTIQAAFGWENFHAHQFLIQGKAYSMLTAEGLGCDDFDDVQDESDVMLSDLIAGSHSRKIVWEYEYDFDDNWLHRITFEGWQLRQPRCRYPICLDGARACPPEDIGGVWGYAEFLQALASDDSPILDHYREQGLGRFDPEAFSVTRATREMRRFWENVKAPQ